MKRGITVVTAALPERLDMLAVSLASIRDQTCPTRHQLVGIDYDRQGPYTMYQTLTDQTDTEWVCHFADDDFAYPNHLATMWDAHWEYDIVATYCQPVGREFTSYNQPFDPVLLLSGESIVSATALFSRAIWDEVGGWTDRSRPNGSCFSDIDFFQRALQAGARIITVPVVTYEYRFHGTNISFPFPIVEEDHGETLSSTTESVTQERVRGAVESTRAG